MGKVPQYESDLIDSLQRGLCGWLRSLRSPWIVAKEVAVGKSVAAVVVLVRVNEALDNLRPLTIEESIILATLRDGRATRIDVLERRCGVARSKLRTGALGRLIDWGLLEYGPGGRIARRRTLAGRSRLLAVEAKLTRWRSALKQAMAYRSYADKSYVALPDVVVRRNSISLDDFACAGVGLLAVTTQRIREIVPAVQAQNHDWRREFVLSRLAHSLPNRKWQQ